MNHLTDDEIQEYLDKSFVENKDKITEHLKICPVCKQQVEAYKNVYLNINTEPDFVTPVNFADNIVSKIESKEDQKYRKWETILLFFTIIQGFGLAFYFIDFKKLISNLSFGDSNLFSVVTEKINGLENGLFPILVFAIIIIVFFGILDRILDQLKKSQITSLV
jgi:hypothetical protein